MGRREDLRPIIMLAGPTGSGKTALAVELAARYPIEIISADSMQVYRGMEIGTAQPDAVQRAGARFHVCGMIDPMEAFNAHRFVELCHAAHREIEARGAVPFYVGGSGLYLRALRWGLLPSAGRNDAIRQELEDQLAKEGRQALHARLALKDPEAAKKIAPADAVRIVRALEVIETTGKPISAQQNQWLNPQPRFPHELIVLDTARELLHEQIRMRTISMLDRGWIDETRALLASGVPRTQHCFHALGYREIFDHIDGRLNRDELIEKIALRTRQFAKRQLTWLRRETPATWIALDARGSQNTVSHLANLLDKPANRSL